MSGHRPSELRAVEHAARSLDDLDELVASAARCRTVLIGEATHGTDDFYRLRAQVTRRLIEDHGFRGVAIEGDWPDTARVHRFVTGLGADELAIEALDGFRRFPAWMWRNAAMLEFVGWLHEHNAERPVNDHVGLFGLDLYSMHASAELVLDYLAREDPEALPRARRRIDCLDGTDPDPQRYGYEVMLRLRPDCERGLIEQVVELTRARGRLVARAATEAGDRLDANDAWFDAHQNATVARNAERYYRTMFRGDDDTWNLRDRHMVETLARVQAHLGRRGTDGLVVWAHNSHVGDARATEMGRRGQWTLGQLVRQEQGDECMLIGFTTWHGTVTAAHEWGGEAARLHVLPARADSYEDLLHATGHDRFWLPTDGLRARSLLRGPLLERAIGVIYRPETERASHYFHADLARQFDVVIHLDETHALEPLERLAATPPDEAAETWPYGT
jgi:erythromycin esterase-like protein